MILMYNGQAVGHGAALVSFGSEPEPSANIWVNDCSQVTNFNPDSSGWYQTAIHNSYATIVLDEPNDEAPANPWNYARLALDTALDCTKGVYLYLVARSPSKESEIAGVILDSANPVLVFRLEDAAGNVTSWIDVSRDGSSGSGTLFIKTSSPEGSADNQCWYTLNSANLASYCSGGFDVSAIKAIHFEIANFYGIESHTWKARKKAIMFKSVKLSDTQIEG